MVGFSKCVFTGLGIILQHLDWRVCFGFRKFRTKTSAVTNTATDNERGEALGGLSCTDNQQAKGKASGKALKRAAAKRAFDVQQASIFHSDSIIVGELDGRKMVFMCGV